MGIFGSKQDGDDQVQASNTTTDIQQGVQPATTATSIDGVVSPPESATPDPAPSEPFGSNSSDPVGQTAPPLDGSATDTSSDFADTSSSFNPEPSSAPTDIPEPVQVTVEEPKPEPVEEDKEEAAPEQAPFEVPVVEEKPEEDAPAIETRASYSTPATSDGSELSDIKLDALKQLSPLVGLLDQSPEEKFHTAMMMVQATDDQSLVKAAFEAAQSITDDKAKAQALLDIVNEINYFTQEDKDS